MRLKQEKQSRKQIIDEREKMTEVFETKRDQLETGAEKEIDELRERNESEIKRITDEMKENDCNFLCRSLYLFHFSEEKYN